MANSLQELQETAEEGVFSAPGFNVKQTGAIAAIALGLGGVIGHSIPSGIPSDRAPETSTPVVYHLSDEQLHILHATASKTLAERGFHQTMDMPVPAPTEK